MVAEEARCKAEAEVARLEVERGVLDGMLNSFDPLPPEFFVNPRCPPISVAIEAMAAEVHHNEAVEEPEKSALLRDFDGTS